MLVVMIYHVFQRGEPAVVIETPLGTDEEAAKRGRSIMVVGRAAGLEIVDPDLLGGMHRPSGLRVEWRHMTGTALRLPFKNGLTPGGGLLVKGVRRWRGGRNR